jgi:hypothetical protein
MKIISGGQTGADRAAIDAALDLNIEHSGSIPLGRKAEDGPIDPKYDKFTEIDSPDYPARTESNIRYSDATLKFTMDAPTGGTAATIKFAREHGKPYLIVDLNKTDPQYAVSTILSWLCQTRPVTLNVAGPRESKCPGIYEMVKLIVKHLLE